MAAFGYREYPTKGPSRKGWKLNLYAISRSSAFSQERPRRRGRGREGGRRSSSSYQGTDFDAAIPFPRLFSPPGPWWCQYAPDANRPRSLDYFGLGSAVTRPRSWNDGEGAKAKERRDRTARWKPPGSRAKYREGRCRNSVCLLARRIYILSSSPLCSSVPYDRYSLYLPRFMAHTRERLLFLRFCSLGPRPPIGNEGEGGIRYGWEWVECRRKGPLVRTLLEQRHSCRSTYFPINFHSSSSSEDTLRLNFNFTWSTRKGFQGSQFGTQFPVETKLSREQTKEFS